MNSIFKVRKYMKCVFYYHHCLNERGYGFLTYPENGGIRIGSRHYNCQDTTNWNIYQDRIFCGELLTYSPRPTNVFKSLFAAIPVTHKRSLELALS